MTDADQFIIQYSPLGISNGTPTASISPLGISSSTPSLGISAADTNLANDPQAPQGFTDGVFSGNITVGGALITGKDTNSGGVSSAQTSTDIVFWAGAAQENRATAPFRVNAAGFVTSSNLTRIGGLYTRTNVTSDATTVLTLPITAASMGTQGTLRITMALTNNSGNSVNVNTNYGGTSFAASLPVGGGVGAIAKHVIDITNLNSASAQVSTATAQSASAITDLEIRTGTVNSALAQNLTVVVNTGGGGIDCFVEFIFVELII